MCALFFIHISHFTYRLPSHLTVTWISIEIFIQNDGNRVIGAAPERSRSALGAAIKSFVRVFDWFLGILIKAEI